jgi:hypothetical protein
MKACIATSKRVNDFNGYNTYINEAWTPWQDDSFGTLIYAPLDAEQAAGAFVEEGMEEMIPASVVADSYPDAFDNFPFWD